MPETSGAGKVTIKKKLSTGRGGNWGKNATQQRIILKQWKTTFIK